MRAVPLALALVGCTRATIPDPSTALRGYLAAVAHDDARAAYNLLSEDLRNTITEGEFATRWRSTTEERTTQADALRDPVARRTWREQAEVVLSNGREGRLVRDVVGWRLVTPRLGEPGAQTPEEALQRLAQALEDHNYEQLVSLLGEPLRGYVEHELGERMTALRAALKKGITVDGERATIRYDPRFHVELKHEDGRWWIVDFN
jgi:hypothetical protein